MRYRFLLLCAIFSISSVVAAQDDYGVLLTTAEQRHRLDARFTISAAQSSADGGTDVNALAAQASSRIYIGGTLISSSGKREVWINGHSGSTDQPSGSASVELLESARVRVHARSSGRRYVLKPGQILNATSGQVSEGYQAQNNQ